MMHFARDCWVQHLGFSSLERYLEALAYSALVAASLAAVNGTLLLDLPAAFSSSHVGSVIVAEVIEVRG